MSDYKQKYLKYKKKYLDLKEQSGGLRSIADIRSPLPNITFDAEWIMDENSVTGKKQNFKLYVEGIGFHQLKLQYLDMEPLQLKKESPIKKYIVDDGKKVVYRFFVDKIKHPVEKDFFINWDNQKNPGLIDEFYANAKKKITILEANNMENISQSELNTIIHNEVNTGQSGGDVQRIVREIA